MGGAGRAKAVVLTSPLLVNLGTTMVRGPRARVPLVSWAWFLLCSAVVIVVGVGGGGGGGGG